MAWTQAELDALKRSYASGTLRVSYEGKTVEYGSEAFDTDSPIGDDGQDYAETEQL